MRTLLESIRETRGRLRLGVLVASVILSGAGLAAQQQDRVVMKKDGKEKSIRIKTEDLDGLWYSAPGGAGNTVIRWDEVDSIQYGGAEAYNKALEAYSAGRISEAVGQLQPLAADVEKRPVIAQNALYYLGLSQGRLGKADEAMQTYQALLKAFPKSRYLVAVGTNVLTLYLDKADVAGAARALEPVLGVAKESGTSEANQAALSVLRGRLLMEQGKFDEAESLLENASKSAKAGPSIVLAAKYGLARSAQKRGRPRDAEQRYRELRKADAPNTVLAGAWNGLGDIAMEQATGARDPEGLRVAALAYLRGIVLYVPSSGDPTEEHERALAGAAKAFKAIGELETAPDKKQLFLERSKQRQGQLASQYPGSRFLKQ